MRGLCNGLGPALYGLIFYLFHVDLNDKNHVITHSGSHANETVHVEDPSVIRVICCYPLFRCHQSLNVTFLQALPGPPFVFGSFLVVCALLVAFFIPEGPLGSHLKVITRRSSG